MIEKRLDNDFAQVRLIRLTENNSAQNIPLKANIHQENNTEGFQGLSIAHVNCTAQVSLYGGQVLRFKPNGHKEVFWLSEQASYQTGKAIRGGIPLCWPWFGANDKESKDQIQQQKAGNHGFARQLPWEIEDISADVSGVTVVLVLAGENQHPLWPNAYKLKQTLFFGKSFKQTLSMSNLSSEDAQYSAALHSYFMVSKPENITIDALTGVNYDDKLTGESNVQQQAVSCVGEIDREYHSSDKMVIVDNHWQRKIAITSEQCQQWVLWNPGTELANTMADVHSGGEQEYVCLEAANSKWQALPAGKTVVISQEITVEKL